MQNWDERRTVNKGRISLRREEHKREELFLLDHYHRRGEAKPLPSWTRPPSLLPKSTVLFFFVTSASSFVSTMNLFHLGLALLMLITGSINTLSVDQVQPPPPSHCVLVSMCNSPRPPQVGRPMKSPGSDGVVRGFSHPFLQACGMFLGEMMCMVAFFIVRWYRKRKEVPGSPPDPMTRPRNFSPLIFLPPAMCDMTATSIQYIGLNLTYASSFQMLRGKPLHTLSRNAVFS